MTTNTKKPSKKRSKTNKHSVPSKITHVAIVLDRSGSMQRFRKEAVDGVNEQFNSLRKNGNIAGSTTVSLLQFDDVVDVVFDDIKSDNLREWGYNEFVPRGGTAMNDAIWKAINHLKSKPKEENTAYLICVISDGEENASKEVTQKIITDEIAALNATGEWTFTYILGGITEEQERDFAKTYIVNESNILPYNLTNASYSAGSDTLSTSMDSYFACRSVGAKSVNKLFTNEEKLRVKNT